MPVKQSFIWHGHPHVSLQIVPNVPRMVYQDLLVVLRLLSSWGARYGFIDCDFAIRMTVPGSRTQQVSYGWGRFLTD